MQKNVITCGNTQVEEALLEGHLGITRELVSFLGPDKKYEIGCHPDKDDLIKVRVHELKLLNVGE